MVDEAFENEILDDDSWLERPDPDPEDEYKKERCICGELKGDCGDCLIQ